MHPASMKSFEINNTNATCLFLATKKIYMWGDMSQFLHHVCATSLLQECLSTSVYASIFLFPRASWVASIKAHGHWTHKGEEEGGGELWQPLFCWVFFTGGCGESETISKERAREAQLLHFWAARYSAQFSGMTQIQNSCPYELLRTWNLIQSPLKSLESLQLTSVDFWSGP